MYQLVAVRQDILEAVGMTDLKTADDLKEFATRAKEKFPEMKGPADIVFKPLTRYFTDEQYNWIAVEDLVVFGEESKKHTATMKRKRSRKSRSLITPCMTQGCIQRI